MAEKVNENRAKANESAKRAGQMPPSVQYAIIQVMPNILNGAFWGFTTLKEIEGHYDSIKSSGGNVVARKLSNACLIEVNPAYLIKAISMIDPEALTQKDLDTMQKMRAESLVSFERFLVRKAKEIKDNKKFGGTIGIYCTNDVNTVTYKGTNYPAFRVEIASTLNLLKKWGYLVRVNGNFVKPDQVGNAIWDSVVLAPTKTGLFIDIQSTLDLETVKQLEKQWKAQNKVN